MTAEPAAVGNPPFARPPGVARKVGSVRCPDGAVPELVREVSG